MPDEQRVVASGALSLEDAYCRWATAIGDARELTPDTDPVSPAPNDSAGSSRPDACHAQKKDPAGLEAAS